MAGDERNPSTVAALRGRQVLAPVSAFILFLAVWQVAVVLLDVPEAILPTPLKIIDTIILRWKLLLVNSLPT